MAARNPVAAEGVRDKRDARDLSVQGRDS